MPKMFTPVSLVVLLLFSGCANYHLNYSPAARDWQQAVLPVEPPVYTIYLIGGTGTSTNAGQDLPALRALQTTLAGANKNSALVFLGDNLYPAGMAPKSEATDRDRAEAALDTQLASFAHYAGRVFFVAGDHDWYEYGVAGLQRQARYLDKESDGKARLLPRPGCGDPVEVELTDDITLLLLDSQWWLANWRGITAINDGCEAKSRADFAFLLQEAMKSNRRQELVVAMHHPVFSNGPHGGKFTLSEHLFPLRDIHPSLVLPLPLVGSAVRLLQASLGLRQDLANSTYNDLRKLLTSQANAIGDVVFAAAHEHSLQYWDKDNQHYIVSGSGARASGSRTGNGARFAYGGVGFSQLNYYPDGQVWVQYFQTPAGAEKQLVYQQKIKPSRAERKLPAPATPEVQTYSFAATSQRTLPLSAVNFQRTATGQAIWGHHYRDAYGTEMQVRELDLRQANLVPVKRGGGFQTNSLRLENTHNGKQYTLRSIDKDASRTVPYPLNTNLILDIVRDNFSASHPLGALAVAPLAEAAGVYHANPQLVYLPTQPALGDFNADYADALYLFEERPDDKQWCDDPAFGNPQDIISTFDMLEEVRQDHDHLVDQRWTIRSRLFDLVIGDWDRHDDQWRWAAIERGKKVYYRPIPRDRDQAFANYDGFIFDIARLVSPKSKQWRPYTDQLGRTHWATYNAFLFDQSFLTGLSWANWQEAASHLQTTLTDEVIEQSFARAWPEPFLGRDGPAIKATIKGRRDQLVAIAQDYYTFLAKNVDVLGTDKKDLFLVERLDDQHTRVRVFDTNKEGDQEAVKYDRTFLSSETQNIYCYGLGDEDIFQVRGQVRYGSKVHLIGGEGDDQFDDQSKSTRAGCLVQLYDFKKEDNQLVHTSDSRDRRSQRPEDNLYNRRSTAYLHNFNAVLPFLGFNPDDKLFAGFQGTYTRYGFHKAPYASQHRYGALVSLASGGVSAYYQGDFAHVIGRWGLQLGAQVQTPLYASNFYGLGNETINPEEVLEQDYNRLRQRKVDLATLLAYRPNPNVEILLGPRFQSIRIDRTPGRYIDEIGDNFPAEVFDGVELLSLEAGLQFNNVDELSFPTRGLRFALKGSWTNQLDGEDFNFPALESELTLYQQLDRQGKLVVATQVGIQHMLSDRFPFFLGAQLGGLGPEGNLRGFRRDRFTGRTAFHHNTDLRWKIGYWNNRAIPMSFGLTTSFDYGKVSLDDIESERIHYSYGAGAFLSPFDLLTIHLGGYVGNGEELRWLFGGAFFF